MSSRVFMAAWWFILLQAPLSRGETYAMVHTLDGKTIVGIPQKLTEKQLSIAPGQGSPLTQLHPGVVWHLFTGALKDLRTREPALEAVRFAPPPLAGVLLTNGAFVAGEISALTGTSVKVKSKRRGEVEFPNRLIARIQFQVSRGESQPLIPDNLTGVITTLGVFTDGDIISFDDKKVVLDSILGGPRTLQIRYVHAVVLAPAPLASSRYILKLTDGSLILTDSLTDKEERIEVNGLLTGSETVKLDMLDQLSAGFRFLEDVCSLAHIRRRPEFSEKDNLTIRNAPPTASKVQVDARRRKVEIAAGSALAFRLDQPRFGFSARIAVPADFPGDAEVLFRVRADNQLVYQSKPMNSASPPELIGLRAPMRNHLVLEVVPSSGDLHEIPGVWIEPVLHRQ